VKVTLRLSDGSEKASSSRVGRSLPPSALEKRRTRIGRPGTTVHDVLFVLGWFFLNQITVKEVKSVYKLEIDLLVRSMDFDPAETGGNAEDSLDSGTRIIGRCDAQNSNSVVI
jgi:hypothetical protein